MPIYYSFIIIFYYIYYIFLVKKAYHHIINMPDIDFLTSIIWVILCFES